jgi:hypothetical protein
LDFSDASLLCRRVGLAAFAADSVIIGSNDIGPGWWWDFAREAVGGASRLGLAPPALVGYRGRIVSGRYDPARFPVEFGYKDLSLALSPLPLASLVHDHLFSAIAKGHLNLDWAALALVARESAGLPSLT